jgi:hypothetical protein
VGDAERDAGLTCKVGGADGIRTHDLLDAIEARSQLRHGPTGDTPKVYHTPAGNMTAFAACLLIPVQDIKESRVSVKSSSCSTLRNTSSLMRPSPRSFRAVCRSMPSKLRESSR